MQALIVDDSRVLRRILSAYLQQLGFQVVEAGNGREALERLHQSESPDVVLVDWNMPEMNGLEFIRSVRAEERFRNLPLMMVTTELEMDHVATALLVGANEYVMKPFSKESIADKLQLIGLL
ncbi:MAG: response regulator [Planctomycetes bacterium]|nr:response regulator [Planctomycetota bacterium]